MSAKTIRIICGVYLAKSLLLGVLWIAIPDLPHRTAVRLRETWTRICEKL
jgi:hypothetical protein